MQHTIRCASPADWPAMGHVQRTSADSDDSSEGSQWWLHLSNKGAVILVAECQGMVIGFGTVDVKESELESLYITKQYQRTGVGSSLLVELERLALERGIRELRVEAANCSESFYASRGYVLTGEVVGSKRRLPVMKKTLS